MTPAVEVARRAGIAFELHTYDGVEVGDGDYAVAVAERLGIEPARLLKTLVASVDGALQVFVLPADEQLDLRAAGKRAVLADRARAERATGYVVGGISPLGQRRALPTTVDLSALEHGYRSRQRGSSRPADRTGPERARAADARADANDRTSPERVTQPGSPGGRLTPVSSFNWRFTAP